MNNDQFTPGKYLSPSQIDIIKSQAENVMDPKNQSRFIQLIDGFVESNGYHPYEHQQHTACLQRSARLLSPVCRQT